MVSCLFYPLINRGEDKSQHSLCYRIRSMTENAQTQSSPYTVAFASNETGIMPLTVAAYSLVQNAKNTTTYNIIVLSEGICKESQTQFEETIKRVSPRHGVRFEEISNLYKSRKEMEQIRGRWPLSAWSRVFLSSLLPEVERVLYLDIDMLVCDDCAELFTMDMKGAAIGAVYEHISNNTKNYNELLGIPNKYLGYFNAGTLLMNLNAFREKNLTEKILSYANSHKEILNYPDQDAMNAVLYDDVIRLHPRWNWNDITTRRILNHVPDTKSLIRAATFREVVEASHYPGILHYCGQYKPWKYNYHITRDRYEKVLKESGVTGFNLREGWSFKIFRKRLFYPIIYALVRKKIRRMVRYFNITTPPPPSTWGHSRDIAAKGWKSELYK